MNDRSLRLRLSAPTQVEVVVRSVYSASLLAAGVSLVVDSVVDAGVPRANARLEAEALGGGWSVDLGGGGARVVADSMLRPALEAIVGIRSISLRLVAGGREQSGEISIIEPWCWPLDSDAWPLLAGWVAPHDGIVQRFRSSLERSGGALNVRDVFATIQRRTEIAYLPPSMLRAPCGTSIQVLRPPWRIVSDLPGARGQGSCLDLALLAAGILEAEGRSPLVVLLLDETRMPVHAVIGAWRDGGRRFRPLLRGEELLEQIRGRAIEVCDLVGACRDRACDSRAGEATALEQIEHADDLVAVDILALRPPHGAVDSFESSSDAVVLCAQREADEAAREIGSPVVETLHLLVGLWRARGEVSDRLLDAIHSTRELELDLCHQVTVSRATPHAGQRTWGFQRCLAEAREMARAQGSTIVRESDLWWAVLGGRSASLDRLFAPRPGVRPALLDTLSAIAPSARPGSEV